MPASWTSRHGWVPVSSNPPFAASGGVYPSCRRALVSPARPFGMLFATMLAASAIPAHAQVRTADPAKRGVPLTEFPRLVKLADRVYGYEEIRSPGFTTVSLVVV